MGGLPWRLWWGCGVSASRPALFIDSAGIGDEEETRRLLHCSVWWRNLRVSSSGGDGFVAFFGGFQGVLRLGHSDGVEDLRDFFFGQLLPVAGDFDNRLAGRYRLLHDLRGLGVAD